MSNSPLVDCTIITSKSNPRKNETYNPSGKITKITIHHMAGNLSVESCGNSFKNSNREASSNYGIGTDGRVGLYVEEDRRAWTSGSRANDYNAVTIEVANDGGAPDWHVSDKALNKLVELCVDICKRNGIAKLNYTGNANGNLTMHKWFQATACPGPYLESKFPWIAEQVNKRLNPVEEKPSIPSSKFKIGDVVRLIAGARYTDGSSIPAWVTKSKLYVRGVQGSDVVISVLKTGDITGVVADKYLSQYPSSEATSTKPENVTSARLNVGDTVKLISGAKYTSGASVPKWVINSTLYVREVQGDNIVISVLRSGDITGVINKRYIAGASSSALVVGDRVKIISGARYTTGQKVPLWVTIRTLYVRGIQGNNVVVSTVKTGDITGVVSKNDVRKVG